MNHERSKFRHHTAEELSQALTQAEKIQFASAEDLIRHDASQTPVPPEIAGRLNESIAREARPAEKSWWKKIFSSGE